MNRPATKYFSVRPRKQSWWHALWVTNNEAFASPFLKHRPEGGSKHLQRQLQSFLRYTYQLLAGFFLCYYRILCYDRIQADIL